MLPVCRRWPSSVRALPCSSGRSASWPGQNIPRRSGCSRSLGVGAITALYFVLKIEDPKRFKHVRDVGAYTGLCPRRDQSGESDPQLRISKRGDAYLRRLLVSAAQYILGPFGPHSALREYGLRLAAWHYPGQEAGGCGRGAQTLCSIAELVEEPNSLSALPCLSQTIEDRRIWNDCDASLGSVFLLRLR